MKSSARTFATAFVFLFGSAVWADEHRDAARHYSFRIPDDWVAISPENLAQLNAEAVRRGAALKMAIHYDAGFRPKESKRGTFPYVLVQTQNFPAGGMSYEQIERDFQKGMKAGVKKAEGAVADVLKNLSVGQAVVDRTRNRVVTRLEMDALGGGKIKVLSVGFLGQSGIVFLHCYAADTEFDKHAPAFDAMLDSFQYAPGHGFVPKSGLAGGAWRKIIEQGLIGAVIVGIAALAVIFVKRKSRLGSKKRTETIDAVGPSGDICQMCGASLNANEARTRLCAHCRSREAGG